MSLSYQIIEAREVDLPLLPVIELAAASLLVGHAAPEVLNETTDIHHFRSARASGRLWVAITGETPVGFVHVTLLQSGAAHLEELDVHPSHGRRGLGRRLVTTACDWAVLNRHRTLTLTTFREPPFNMRFYASCGFEEIPSAALEPELSEIVANEARRGLSPERRVVMRWRNSARDS